MGDVVNQALLSALQALVQKDLETRAGLLREQRLYGVYESEMQAVHTENALALDGLIAAHGWPGISQVGPEGTRAAWLVAQHAICTPALQRKFLRLLEQAVAEGEAPARQAAMLSDRIRFNEGRPQQFGTVLDWTDEGVLGCELEEPERIDERRAAVGLPPFADALKEHQQEVAAEGGRPPEDLAAYRQRAEAWACKMGWR